MDLANWALRIDLIFFYFRFLFFNILDNLLYIYICYLGAKSDWNFRISDLVENSDGTYI